MHRQEYRKQLMQFSCEKNFYNIFFLQRVGGEVYMYELLSSNKDGGKTARMKRRCKKSLGKEG